MMSLSNVYSGLRARYGKAEEDLNTVVLPRILNQCFPGADHSALVCKPTVKDIELMTMLIECDLKSLDLNKVWGWYHTAQNIEEDIYEIHELGLFFYNPNTCHKKLVHGMLYDPELQQKAELLGIDIVSFVKKQLSTPEITPENITAQFKEKFCDISDGDIKNIPLDQKRTALVLNFGDSPLMCLDDFNLAYNTAIQTKRAAYKLKKDASSSEVFTERAALELELKHGIGSILIDDFSAEIYDAVLSGIGDIEGRQEWANMLLKNIQPIKMLAEAEDPLGVTNVVTIKKVVSALVSHRASQKENESHVVSTNNPISDLSENDNVLAEDDDIQPLTADNSIAKNDSAKSIAEIENFLKVLGDANKRTEITGLIKRYKFSALLEYNLLNKYFTAVENNITAIDGDVDKNQPLEVDDQENKQTDNEILDKLQEFMLQYGSYSKSQDNLLQKEVLFPNDLNEINIHNDEILHFYTNNIARVDAYTSYSAAVDGHVPGILSINQFQRIHNALPDELKDIHQLAKIMHNMCKDKHPECYFPEMNEHEAIRILTMKYPGDKLCDAVIGYINQKITNKNHGRMIKSLASRTVYGSFVGFLLGTLRSFASLAYASVHSLYLLATTAKSAIAENEPLITDDANMTAWEKAKIEIKYDFYKAGQNFKNAGMNIPYVLIFGLFCFGAFGIQQGIAATITAIEALDYSIIATNTSIWFNSTTFGQIGQGISTATQSIAVSQDSMVNTVSCMQFSTASIILTIASVIGIINAVYNMYKVINTLKEYRRTERASNIYIEPDHKHTAIAVAGAVLSLTPLVCQLLPVDIFGSPLLETNLFYTALLILGTSLVMTFAIEIGKRQWFENIKSEQELILVVKDSVLANLMAPAKVNDTDHTLLEKHI